MRCHSMSAPAQKLSPSPESTTDARIADVRERFVSSAISSASNAFRRSGLASVTRRTRPVALDSQPAHRPDSKVAAC